ncbi:hypothetical protein J4475_01315, partial [Candidatus Woesearchaeota archaeon]|nr:hypothetical protein [Candidatus Woesearchaeota archaeon]
KITIGGKAGKKAAWARGTSALTEITTLCDDAANPTNINTGSPRECYIDSGSDLVIWTYHFTQFAAFSPSSGGGSVGSGGGGGRGYLPVCGDAVCSFSENAKTCPLDCALPTIQPAAPAEPVLTPQTVPAGQATTVTQPAAPSGFAAITGAIATNLIGAINKAPRQETIVAVLLLVAGISIAGVMAHRALRRTRR